MVIVIFLSVQVLIFIAGVMLLSHKVDLIESIGIILMATVIFNYLDNHKLFSNAVKSRTVNSRYNRLSSSGCFIAGFGCMATIPLYDGIQFIMMFATLCGCAYWLLLGRRLVVTIKEYEKLSHPSEAAIEEQKK